MRKSQVHPELLLVSRRAKFGYESEFERLMAEFITAAEAFPGCLGAQLVKPGDEDAVEDTFYHALIAFKETSSLDAWQYSAERASGLARIAPYIEGPALVRGISGLANWFQPQTSTKSRLPPRWKVAIVTWLGIFPTVYLLFIVLEEPLASWSLLARIFLLTLLVVVIMTWIVAPQLTRMLSPWLFSSAKHNHKNDR